jgi:hypothetical protein
MCAFQSTLIVEFSWTTFEARGLNTKLHMIFSAPYCLRITLSFIIVVILYRAKLLVFYNVQTTNLTFLGKIYMRYTITGYNIVYFK